MSNTPTNDEYEDSNVVYSSWVNRSSRDNDDRDVNGSSEEVHKNDNHSDKDADATWKLIDTTQ